MRRFSAPVCSSSSAAYWPVRLIRRRTVCRSRATSWPPTVAPPPSGLTRVARIRTSVVFPGSRQAQEGEHGSGPDGEVDPVQNPFVAKRLREALSLHSDVHHG